MRLLLVAALMTLAPVVSAQSTTSAPSPAIGPAPSVEPQGYAYKSEGRRDPFVNLTRRGTEAKAAPVNRAAGLAGMPASEISLRGVVISGDQLLGIVHAPDNKSYIVRPGQKLLDGTIRSIGPDSMVIVQRVTDPLGAETQRELRKVLRQEEAK
jgi:Tfp pilus assembly protein PilP